MNNVIETVINNLEHNLEIELAQVDRMRTQLIGLEKNILELQEAIHELKGLK